MEEKKFNCLEINNRKISYILYNGDYYYKAKDIAEVFKVKNIRAWVSEYTIPIHTVHLVENNKSFLYLDKTAFIYLLFRFSLRDLTSYEQINIIKLMNLVVDSDFNKLTPIFYGENESKSTFNKNSSNSQLEKNTSSTFITRDEQAPGYCSVNKFYRDRSDPIIEKFGGYKEFFEEFKKSELSNDFFLRKTSRFKSSGITYKIFKVVNLEKFLKGSSIL